MTTIIETNRLYLREFTIEDAEHFFYMNNDFDVIKHTGDTPFDSINDAKMFLKDYNQYKLHGMGRWAVCLKEDNTFLGWCGLKYHPKEKLVEVGYRFYKKFWNNGYATESAKASIKYGFENLKLKDIYAHCHIDNLASQKVIEKCGLSFLNNGIYDNMPAKLYKTKNPYLNVKKISANETHSVRHPVLRAGCPIEDCIFDGDTLKTTYHLGLYFKKELIGVVTLMKNKHDFYIEKSQYQLRGMAILHAYQKKGLGELLILEAEKLLKDLQTERLWLNAREVAVSFYKNQGYNINGDAFQIPKIGLHYTMSKKFI
ncbi:GNAT family N-acetyltransferase [Corallibacter sp.]|uniref:GNAT family N-acetyltransferase n=1 Tax=Corallibacter sp. TaxID=2038084 RepID=UPI003A910264